MKRATLMLAALALLLGGVGQAKASFIITFAQSGPNVVATGEGSFDLSALNFDGSLSIISEVNPANDVALIGSAQSTDFYSYLSGPPGFGSAFTTPATTGTGPLAGMYPDQGVPDLVVPTGYSSGTPLSDSSTWDNTTISGLGLTPGTYTYTWGSGATADSLEVVIPGSVSAAPEPSTLALLAFGGVSLLGYTGLRRRRKVPTA